MRARVWVLRAGAIGVVAVLATWLWGQFAPDLAVSLDGKARTSSPGRYASELLTGGINGRRNMYPVIKNSAGEVLWSDDRRYLMSVYPMGVVWQKDADVLWLLPDDIDTSRVVKKDGEWIKEWDWDTLPLDIERTKKG